MTRSWESRVNEADAIVDEHVADDVFIHVNGGRLAVRGTFATEEIEIQQENSLIVSTMQTLSIREQHLPTRLIQNNAIIERVDPYQDNPTAEYFDVISVDRSHTGRSRLTLRLRHGSDAAPVESRNVQDTNSSANR